MQVIKRGRDNLGAEQTLFTEPILEDIKSKITNKRQSIIKMFVDEINKGRRGTQWKPLTKIGIRKLAILLGRHPMLKTDDQLYEFYSLCKQSKSFSGKCYGTLNPKEK